MKETIIKNIEFSLIVFIIFSMLCIEFVLFRKELMLKIFFSIQDDIKKAIIYTNKRKKIIIPLLVLIFFFIYLPNFFPTVEDFAIGASASTFVVVLSILIVEYYMEEIKNDDNLPKRIAIYNDIRYFFERFYSDWNIIYGQTVQNKLELDYISFFSTKGMSQIWLEMDIHNPSKIIGKPEPLIEKLVKLTDNHMKLADNILNRYMISDYMPPFLYLSIQNITYSSVVYDIYSTHEIVKDFPYLNRNKLLSSPEKWDNGKFYKSCIEIHKWTINEYKLLNKELKNNNKYEIQEPYLYKNSNT